MKGDTETKKINIVIPANIRFKHYETFEQIKFENKFAPIALSIPIEKDVQKSLKEVPKVTKALRTKFFETYAMYAMSYYFSMFSPYFLQNWFIKKSTLPFTLAFSNTPGLLKPVVAEGNKKSRMMTSYIIPAGHTGIGFSALSYIDNFKITCLADEAILKDPQTLVDLMEKNLKSCYDNTPRSDTGG